MVCWYSACGIRLRVSTMKKIFFLLCGILSGTSLMSSDVLLHGKAVSAGRSGNHQEAQHLLQRALVSDPSNASVLYDAGVAEFKCGNFSDALNYFEKAASCSKEQVLHEEALFNAGTAAAHLKKYDDALKNYDKILSENPTHERARHNSDMVKKMKDQEESSPNQDDKNNQDSNQKEDSDASHDDSEKNENSQDGVNDSSDNDKSAGSKDEDELDSNDDPSEDGQKEHDNDDKKEDSKQKSSKEKSKNFQKASSGEQQQESGDESQEGEDSPTNTNKTSHDRQNKYNESQKDQGNTHAHSPRGQEQKDIQSNHSGTNTQLPTCSEQDRLPPALEGPDKQWMRSALESCDKQDMNHNKQLLKAVVGSDKGDNRAVRHSW